MLPVSRRGRPEGIVIEHGRKEQGRARRFEERKEPGGGQRSDREGRKSRTVENARREG